LAREPTPVPGKKKPIYLVSVIVEPRVRIDNIENVAFRITLAVATMRKHLKSIWGSKI
jgi:hypothetical protein